MTVQEAAKGEIKKLAYQAVQAKMNLHDLAEDLPTNWQQIPAIAQRAYEIYPELEARRSVLKDERD